MNRYISTILNILYLSLFRLMSIHQQYYMDMTYCVAKGYLSN